MRIPDGYKVIVASDGSDTLLLTPAIKVESLWFVAVIEFDAVAALTAAVKSYVGGIRGSR